MTLLTGQIIDRKYRIVRELGSGAMGAVYEGENVRIKRRVAIKVLLPGVADREDTVRRFEREAQAAGRIGSDHIVEVLDLGTLPDGGLYMVMEFLEGMTLGERIRSRGRLDATEIIPITQQLLMGLELAHEAGIVHRDLKPDNVYLCSLHGGQEDFVKILDFGISKFNPLNTDDGHSMTKTGTVMGTPFYMAPEQAKGARDIDHRSDLYSVGVILYEAITGQVPFHAGTFNELIFKIVLETPPPPENFVPDLDPAFSMLIRRAMSREPADRFQTAADFSDGLSIWLHTGREESAEAPVEPPVPSSSYVNADMAWDDDDGAATVMAAGPPNPGAYPAARGGVPDPGYPPAPPGQGYATDEDLWPIAGIPGAGKPARKTAALIGGAVATLGAGAVAAMLLLSPGSADSTKTSPGNDATLGAPNTTETSQQPAAAAQDENDEDDEDDETDEEEDDDDADEDEDSDDDDAETDQASQPQAGPGNNVAASGGTAKASPQPRVATKPSALPPKTAPTSKLATGKPPKPKSTSGRSVPTRGAGRRLATEL